MRMIIICFVGQWPRYHAQNLLGRFGLCFQNEKFCMGPGMHRLSQDLTREAEQSFSGHAGGISEAF